MFRARIFTPKNIVILCFLLMFIGIVWMGQQCNTYKDSICTDEMRNKIHLVNQRLQRRESSLQLKEDELHKKLKLLGIKDLTWYDMKDIPMIYMITPTYSRLTQKADLTRLSHTLLHIPKLHWIVVEDSHERTDLVSRFLARCGVSNTHLAVRTPKELITNEGDPRWLKARGVEQRNLGLRWVRENFDRNAKGVVYFGDDDNTYDVRIFQQMRYTKKVSLWPVGLVGGLKWEGPICENGSVVKFYTLWKPERPMPMDMAGFAVNVQLFIDNPDVEMDTHAKRGYLESSVIGRLATRDEFEPLADNCKQILVWHTQTAKPKMKQELRLSRLGRQSDPSMEV